MMVSLLAQVEKAAEVVSFDWEKLLYDRGPLYVVFTLVIVALVRYGPAILTAMPKIAENTQAIRMALKAHSDEHKVTQDALHHMAEAGKRATECEDVTGQLDMAQQHLRRPRAVLEPEKG